MDLPQPTITDLNEPYWQGLADGELRFARCRNCAHAWLPPREECQNCLSTDWDWEVASGRGRIISWVVYQHAFHEAMEERIPFNVAIVELDEGPRLITNVNAPDDQLGIDRPVVLEIDLEGGTHIARFRVA